MFENFNYEDKEEVKRLFSYLDKDKFNSLSLNEQNEVIDTLVNLSRKAEVGFVKGSNGNTRNLNVQKIIDEMGYEPFREVMRLAVLNGALQTISMPVSKIKDLCKKSKDGTLTNEEEQLVDDLMSVMFYESKVNDPEDVRFSTYTISHLYYSITDRAKNDKDVNILKDAQPFINAAYINLLTSLIGNKGNAISSMFNKQGFDKTLVSLNDLTVKFADLIIEYSKDNDIAPERTLMALMNVVKILAEPLNTSLECYPDDKIDEVIGDMLIATLDDKDLKSTSNDNTTKSANADKKESQDDNDIRKLLLDD